MTEVDPRSVLVRVSASEASANEHKQEAYARQRWDHTSLFRAWFRAWSDYEALWNRIMLEPEDIEDVHRGQRPR
jgi:hypothetical protein